MFNHHVKLKLFAIVRLRLHLLLLYYKVFRIQSPCWYGITDNGIYIEMIWETDNF